MMIPSAIYVLSLPMLMPAKWPAAIFSPQLPGITPKPYTIMMFSNHISVAMLFCVPGEIWKFWCLKLDFRLRVRVANP